MDQPDKRQEYLALLNKILEKSDETSERIVQLEKKMDLHVQKTEYEIKGIKELDAQQNESLREHIEGVRTLKKMHEAQTEYFDSRIEILERPKIVIAYIEKWVLRIGGIVAAIYGILKFLGKV